MLSTNVFSRSQVYNSTLLSIVLFFVSSIEEIIAISGIYLSNYYVFAINARLLALEVIYSVCSDALAKAINMLRLTSSFFLNYYLILIF